MIACSMRASCLAIASASLLFASTARAEDARAGAPVAIPAETPESTPRIAAPTVRRVDASEPRKITGMVLTALGIYHGFAGTVVLTTFATVSGGTGGFGLGYGLLFGGPLIGEGLILSCIGIPLWVTGAKTVEVVDPPVADWAPDIDVGAGTASATWHF
jgi:hypothetical protein